MKRSPVHWIQILLFSALLANTLHASASTRGSHFMDMCIKDASGAFPETCVQFMTGLLDGLMTGARKGALKAAELQGGNPNELNEMDESEPGIFLGFCEPATLDVNEVVERVYNRLLQDRSRLPQPITITVQEVLMETWPARDCQVPDALSASLDDL